jgi:hypothetical protein
MHPSLAAYLLAFGSLAARIGGCHARVSDAPTGFSPMLVREVIVTDVGGDEGASHGAAITNDGGLRDSELVFTACTGAYDCPPQ